MILILWYVRGDYYHVSGIDGVPVPSLWHLPVLWAKNIRTTSLSDQGPYSNMSPTYSFVNFLEYVGALILRDTLQKRLISHCLVQFIFYYDIPGCCSLNLMGSTWIVRQRAVHNVLL